MEFTLSGRFQLFHSWHYLAVFVLKSSPGWPGEFSPWVLSCSASKLMCPELGPFIRKRPGVSQLPHVEQDAALGEALGCHRLGGRHPVPGVQQQPRVSAEDAQRSLQLTETRLLRVARRRNKCFSCAINNRASKDVV